MIDEKSKRTQVLACFTAILLIGVATPPAFGEEIATTADGRRVVLNDDGTWRYLEESQAGEGGAAAEVPDIDSQDLSCEALIETSVDKMTGNRITAMAEAMIISEDGDTGFAFNVFQGPDNTIVWLVAAKGAGNCVDDDDKVNILFTDGSRLELVNDGDFNCDPNITLYFRGIFGKRDPLNQLRVKTIESMRVWTRGEFLQREIPSGDAERLRMALDCLAR